MAKEQKQEGPEIQTQTHTQWTGSGTAIDKNVAKGNHRSMLRVLVASNFGKLQITALKEHYRDPAPPKHTVESSMTKEEQSWDR